MIRERLQNLDIKITELASYLQLSRPTMYKFIEAYDQGQTKTINKNVLKVFDYISNNELIDKRNVVAFILTSLTDQKATGTPGEQEMIREIKNYISKNPESEKTAFIRSCVKKSQFDLIIHYLMEISPLVSKKKLSSEEKKKMKPYEEIIGIYSKDI